MRCTLLALLSLLVLGCGSKSPEVAEPAPTPAEPTPAPTDAPPPDAPQPSKMTAEDCTAQGGTVVGDPGDGSTHRPDFRCASGKPPIGAVDSGIEGAVCCGA